MRRAGVTLLVLFSLGVSYASGTEKSDEKANPTMTCSATRGLFLTSSAETMGSGRLSFSFVGTWYEQKLGFPLTPNTGAKLYTGAGAFSFGVNRFIDLFASGALFATHQYTNGPKTGPGSVLAGIQGELPLPATSPVHLGAQGIVIGGTSNNQLDSNRADGYDYFETRTGFDFTGKLLQSLVFGDESQSIKIHFNEGAVFSTQKARNYLLLAMGLQANLHSMIALGLELNSRSTFSNNATFTTDPLWLTPSMHIRTPYDMNFIIGSDISISKNRSDMTTATRSLEKFRIFGGINFSLDLLANKRKAERDSAEKAAQEKEDLLKDRSRLKANTDSLTKKMREDSLSAAQLHAAERGRQDSLAEKMRQDSIVLVATNQRLLEEISKRSDAEKQLLSTGMLLMDAVYFESGKTEISLNSSPYLTIIGKMLTKYPKLMIEVAGHTDNLGSRGANLQLSFARASSVRSFLIMVAPELGSRLTAVSYGPDRPKESNSAAAGRKVNRRVELQVLNKDVLKEYNP